MADLDFSDLIQQALIPLQGQVLKVSACASSLMAEPFDPRVIEDYWLQFCQEKRAEGRKVWNGTFYRFERLFVNEARNEVCLECSIFEMKQMMYLRSIAGQSNYVPPANLFVASMTRTSDGLYVFGHASGTTLEEQAVNVVGGTLSKSELEIHDYQDIRQSLLNELYEELGVTLANITACDLLALVRTHRDGVGLLFKSELNCSKAELQKIFEANDNDELSELEFINPEKVADFMLQAGGYLPTLSLMYI